MLNVNTLLLPLESMDRSPISETMVVIFSDHATNRIFLLNYQNEPKKPLLFPLTTILSWIETDLITTAEMTLPSLYFQTDSQQTARAIEKRNKRFKAIAPIIENLEEFLLAIYGSKLIEKAANQAEATRSQIYRWTYLFLRRGQTKNALLPNYQNLQRNKRKLSGARLGRPPRSPSAPYKQKTEQDERNLKRVLNQHYLIQGGLPLTRVYKMFLALHFSNSKRVLPDGTMEFELHSTERTYPSISQFRNWTKTYLKQQGINAERVRMGNSKYDKDQKARSGDHIRATGPGEIYQIDATPGDINLVSQFDKFRNLRVNRPTIYSVADVFSEAIVGIYISLAPPSWHGMRLALFNAFRSKVSFAQEFGITITDADWPMSVPCLNLFGDNAELVSRLSESLIEDLGITVKFGRPYRGDDKGLVEKSFDHFNQKQISALPGFIKKNSKSRGEKDPKLEALLTLPELSNRLIDYIIHHNNFEECSSRLLNKQMVADGVLPRRRDIWNWGAKHRPFSGKAIPEEHLYMHLLEKGQASVHREGVYFKQLWYVCEWTLANGHQNQKTNRNRVKEFDVRFMRHSTDQIFLCTPDGLQLAFLKPDSMRFHDCSFDEVENQLDRENDERTRRMPESLSSELSLMENTKLMINSARSEQVRLSKAEINKQSITENSAFDIEHEESREYERLQRFTDSVFGLSHQSSSDVEESDQLTQEQSKRKSAHQDAMNNLFGSTDGHDS